MLLPRALLFPLFDISIRQTRGGNIVKTPLIIGATVVGTVAVFSTGGIVALSFMKQMMPETQQVAAAPAPAEVAAPEPAVEPAQTPAPVVAIAAPVVNAEPAEEVVVSAPAAPSTDDIIEQLMASQDKDISDEEVVIYDFVSASQSEDQFKDAIPERLRKSVVAALDGGKTVSELGQMVQSAVDLGLVEAPAALSTGDGTPDARAILLSIVNQYEKETGKTFQKTALVEEAPLSNGRNVTYVVEPGDSLAYLALKFYGNTAEYRVIYNANRSKIGQPDKIQVGQRLIIPAL